MIKALITLFTLALPVVGWSQLTVDKVMAIVDEDVVLKSEVDYQYRYLVDNGQKDDGTLYCRVLESQLSDRLLLAKAKLDSVMVSDDRVSSELDRRLMIMASQYGGQEKMEKVIGKSLVELRVELREDIYDRLLIDAQKEKIFADKGVTPREVTSFFKSIPEDSIPNLPVEVEISKIVIKPKASEAAKRETKQKLAGVLADIRSGKLTFKEAAKKHSIDGSGKDGGFLGEITRKSVVPAFATTVYNMKEGEISNVFESMYGFHIALLHKRVGERVVVSHILMRPRVSSEDEKLAKEKLMKIRALIENNEITFSKAAAEYSDDQATKDIGGMISDPRTGSYKVPLDKLDVDLYLAIDEMEVGDISDPIEVFEKGPQIEKAYEIVYLRARHAPHRASLATDYEKFSEAARQAKQAEALDEWFEASKSQVYIEIKHEGCEQALQDWYRASK